MMKANKEEKAKRDDVERFSGAEAAKAESGQALIEAVEAQDV